MQTIFYNWIPYIISSFYLVFLTALNAHVIKPGNSLQLGDNIAIFSLAKILSLKYNIPLEVHPFLHSNLFVFDDVEKKWSYGTFDLIIHVSTEKDIQDNLHRASNILFWTDIRTQIDEIPPGYIKELQSVLQLKVIPFENEPQYNKMTIAVHIRKGNGGGQYYDGEQSSLQEYEIDQTKITYLDNFFNYPFDWSSYKRSSLENGILVVNDMNVSLNNEHPRKQVYDKNTGKPVYIDLIEDYQTKFPSNQYYIDQIKYVYKKLGCQDLQILLFTDDKNPEALMKTIKNAINLSNVDIQHHNHEHLPFSERIAKDLYLMSKCDVLIRSQSYFARVSELMGNHKIVISPLTFMWEGNKLIMNTIVIKQTIRTDRTP